LNLTFLNLCPSKFHPITLGCNTLLFLCFFLCSLHVQAQNRDQLEQERMNLIKQIENTSAALSKNKKNKSKAVEQINLLEAQISNRKELIGNINSSINNVETNITDNRALIDTLTNDLIALRSNYESLAQIQLRKKFTNNPLILLLSAHSWSDAIKRWKLFKQFEFYFEKQSESLKVLSGAFSQEAKERKRRTQQSH